MGLAFDGDADRCFFVDENGDAVSPNDIISLIATRELIRHPGSAIVYNVVTSKAVAEQITEHGGKPIRTRVGHSFIKQVMADYDAVFGGEHCGHYYFRHFWRADTGMLAALHVLAALGQTDQPLSALAAQFSRYVVSGEVNRTIARPLWLFLVFDNLAARRRRRWFGRGSRHPRRSCRLRRLPLRSSRSGSGSQAVSPPGRPWIDGGSRGSACTCIGAGSGVASVSGRWRALHAAKTQSTGQRPHWLIRGRSTSARI
ncbi:hypothetical protein [Kribbella sp. VKM Ac-2571]|uniref:hypothetical protein n=1 Tax=Kribbella sp. VKM Ac-2571 TaxID=2512222 RepID=UPI001EDF5EF8|nr:hypothetical protein [Kribbella sp. VKM Ac-2571]